MEGDMKNVIKYWIEGEIESFIKVWLLIYASLCYCYLATKILPKGSFRLFSFLPVMIFFLYVPLKINSVHLCGSTGFFISWLCNFKLILLAFDQGPLSDSSLSVTKFLILACLPIRIQQKSELYVENGVHRGKFHQNGHFQETLSLNLAEKVSIVQSGKDFAQNGHFQETPSSNSVDKTENSPFQDGTPSQKSSEKGSSVQSGKHFAQSGHFPSSAKSKKGQKLNYVIKTLLFALIIRVYDYSDYIHPHIIMVIYCFHIYLCLEIILVIVSGLARGFFGLQLEPQFNEPYLSTSLQDFWGRRLESHCHSYPSAQCIQAHSKPLREHFGPEVGPTSCRDGYIHCIGLNA
ncbi:hypothetical protein HAX54_002433 [Datura stramonium]|uniref:Uncharacterized protein n=1 Tax=Datura stramonium TaxID=4076 RepID=A0ABS8T554_DATST|nr:hypothetical protein [Datura stramonium]